MSLWLLNFVLTFVSNKFHLQTPNTCKVTPFSNSANFIMFQYSLKILSHNFIKSQISKLKSAPNIFYAFYATNTNRNTVTNPTAFSTTTMMTPTMVTQQATTTATSPSTTPVSRHTTSPTMLKPSSVSPITSPHPTDPPRITSSQGV